MSAFAVFTREKTLDQAEMDEYTRKVKATFAGHQIKIHAAYGPQEMLEGDPIEGAVIIEFPTMAAAKAWYYSPAYQEVVKHRHKGASYQAYIVEGL